jgi:cytosine/adenosine deaminase-related metal-dependent hydrolase
VTTLLDFSHCNNTPVHADAAIDGLRAAGIRALHCYGFFAATRDNPAFPTHEHRRADFARVARSHSSAGGLLKIGAALTEVGVLPWNDTVAEIQAAREAGARMVLHTGCVWGSVVTLGVKEMYGDRLLGPDQVHVHCNTLDDEECSMLGDAGAKVSISPETELNMGMGRLAFEGCRGHGIRPTLSCDIVSLNSGDLFAQMRLALAWQRFADNEPVNRAGGMPRSLTYTARDALRWATHDGAEACGLESLIGSLGKQADVIVVGGPESLALRPHADPVASVVFQAAARDVRDVFVAGKHRKRDGRLVGVDLGRLLDEAERSAASILGRVRASSPKLPPRPAGGFEATEALARAHLAAARAQRS